MIALLHDYIVGIILVVGSFFALVAAIGVVRLPDLYCRMHSASKAGAVGSGLILIALAIFTDDQATATRALAGVAFLLLTAPISAHLLGKAAHAAGFELWSGSVLDEMPRPERGTHVPDRT